MGDRHWFLCSGRNDSLGSGSKLIEFLCGGIETDMILGKRNLLDISDGVEIYLFFYMGSKLAWF